MSNPNFTVLCVDDEANILSALRRLFRPTGYRLLTAQSGAEGLVILEQEQGQVDVVISDMRMPEMDGATFLAEVLRRWPNTLRMLLTGYSDLNSTVSAINQGEIYRYLAKPWNDQDLLLTVQDGLEKQALLREKQRLEALTQQQNEQLKQLNASLEDKVKARTAELYAAHERLKKNFISSIHVFSHLIELRDGHSAGFSRRVATLARRIAGQLGIDHKATQDIFLAGLLHTLGKISLPDRLLSKPVSQLSAEEKQLWAKHPLKGQQALMGLEELAETARLIRAYCEHFNGQGVPEGLAGMQIPLGARVLAVASDFYAWQDGMLEEVSYSENEARKRISQGAGMRYDPAVVAAFNALFTEQPQTTPETEIVELYSINLLPGMILARDLFSRDGVLLLAADFVLEERTIRQICEYESIENKRLVLSIYRHSDPVSRGEILH